MGDVAVRGWAVSVAYFLVCELDNLSTVYPRTRAKADMIAEWRRIA